MPGAGVSEFLDRDAAMKVAWQRKKKQYKEMIPEIMGKLGTVSSQQELNVGTPQFAESLVRPFKPRGRGPKERSARAVWTAQLGNMNKRRSRLYRTAERTRRYEDYRT